MSIKDTIYRMNPIIKDKWVAALRSGKYRKARNRLHNRFKDAYTGEYQDSYCALGVLCDIAVQEGVQVNVINPTTTGYKIFDGTSTTLPESIREWAGLNGYTDPSVMVVHDPKRPEDSAQKRSITALNDVDNMSFQDMAKFIEEFL